MVNEISWCFVCVYVCVCGVYVWEESGRAMFWLQSDSVRGG